MRGLNRHSIPAFHQSGVRDRRVPSNLESKTLMAFGNNARGGSTLVVLGVALSFAVIAAVLLFQGRSFIDRMTFRSAEILKDVQFENEIKFILSQPNCGIVDLDSGTLARSGPLAGSFEIVEGLRSDLLGGSEVLKKDSIYRKFDLVKIYVSEFDPKYYSRIHGAASAEGLFFKDISGMNREFVRLGATDDYLASLNVISKMEGKIGGHFLSSFAVIVKIENNRIESCRSVNTLGFLAVMCEKAGGNWDFESFTCVLEPNVAAGVSQVCPMNERCNADVQFVK